MVSKDLTPVTNIRTGNLVQDGSSPDFWATGRVKGLTKIQRTKGTLLPLFVDKVPLIILIKGTPVSEG